MPRFLYTIEQKIFIFESARHYHQCPDPDTFRSYRNQLNRKINSLPTKHNMLIVAGPNNLDNEKYFKRKDGTHLTWEGKSLQFRILLRTLSNLITDGL